MRGLLPGGGDAASWQAAAPMLWGVAAGPPLCQRNYRPAEHPRSSVSSARRCWIHDASNICETKRNLGRVCIARSKTTVVHGLMQIMEELSVCFDGLQCKLCWHRLHRFDRQLDVGLTAVSIWWAWCDWEEDSAGDWCSPPTKIMCSYCGKHRVSGLYACLHFPVHRSVLVFCGSQTAGGHAMTALAQRWLDQSPRPRHKSG